MYREVPRGLRRFLRPYLKALSKPQRAHFLVLIAGLVVHDNKTIQEINDALSTGDQSCLNRFVHGCDFQALNELRLDYVQRKLPSRDDGLLIVDDSLAHKTGRKMEKAGRHRSGVTKRVEWGHKVVNSYYTHPVWNWGYPVNADIYTNKNNAQYEYRPIKRMALEQVQYARAHRIRGTACMDALYYADYVVHELEDNKEKYLLGAPSTLKISVERRPRKSLAEYAEGLVENYYERFRVKGKWYRIHTIRASIRSVGTRRIVISYAEEKLEDKKFYVTNLDIKEKKLMRLLVCRWSIECWHRDGKQHLGLEDYQVRKDRAVRNVVLAVQIAYTALVQSQRHPTLRRLAKAMGRPLRTIGEICRLMRLAATKGWRWLTRMLRTQPDALTEILNREVVVKNAKV